MIKHTSNQIISIFLPAVAVSSCCLFVFWLADVFATEKPVPDKSLRPIAIFDFLGGVLWVGAIYSIPPFKKWRPISVFRERPWPFTILPSRSAWTGYFFSGVTWAVMVLYWTATRPEDTAPWWLNVHAAPLGALFATMFWPSFWANQKQKLEVSKKV